MHTTLTHNDRIRAYTVSSPEAVSVVRRSKHSPHRLHVRTAIGALRNVTTIVTASLTLQRHNAHYHVPPVTHLCVLHVHRVERDQAIVVHHLTQRSAHAAKPFP
jgi:hypothetical protein